MALEGGTNQAQIEWPGGPEISHVRSGVNTEVASAGSNVVLQAARWLAAGRTLPVVFTKTNASYFARFESLNAAGSVVVSTEKPFCSPRFFDGCDPGGDGRMSETRGPRKDKDIEALRLRDGRDIRGGDSGSSKQQEGSNCHNQHGPTSS